MNNGIVALGAAGHEGFTANKYVYLVRALTVGLITFPSPVLAGAWTLKESQGMVVVTGTISEAREAFNTRGDLRPIPRYSKGEAQALFEYGYTDFFTVIAAPSLQYVHIAAPVDARRDGLGYSEIGGRVRLWSNDSWVASTQTILRLPGTSDRSNIAAIGYTDPEIDVRALLGHSFTISALPAFFDLQIGQRFRLGGQPDEFRGDFTFGIRPLESWLLLAQSFNVVSEGAGTLGYPAYSYHKLQLSVVYAVTPALSLQIGGYTTFAGQNALQENGIVLGTWYKF